MRQRHTRHFLSVLAAACLLAGAASADTHGVCSRWKGSEIKCTIHNERQGFLVDIHPLRPHVRARIITFWTSCGISGTRPYDDTYVFSHQPRTIYYRYNKALRAVYGTGGASNCIEVYIRDCAEIAEDHSESRGDCATLLTAYGLTLHAR
jgi:hypothetical protein